jgi:hypothetical protein
MELQIDKGNKDEILLHAQKVLHYSDLVIQQCDSWLSAEEANENLMKSIMERNKKTKILTGFSGLPRFFRKLKNLRKSVSSASSAC